MGCGNLCLPVWRWPFRCRIRDLRCRGACDVCPGAPALKVTGNCEQFSTSPIPGSRNVCGGARELRPSRWKTSVLENDRKAETRTSSIAPMTTWVAQQAEFCGRASRNERLDWRLLLRAAAPPSTRTIGSGRRKRNKRIELRQVRIAPAVPSRKAPINACVRMNSFVSSAWAVAPTFFIFRNEVDFSTFRIRAAGRRRQRRRNEVNRCPY